MNEKLSMNNHEKKKRKFAMNTYKLTYMKKVEISYNM